MKMKLILFFFLSIISFDSIGQDDVIKLELLPTTYGEGMSSNDLEKRIIKYIKNTPRFEVINTEGKYDDVSIDATGGRLTIVNPNQEKSVITTTPYLLHLDFGGHTKVFLTISLFDVSTGVLKESVSINSGSGGTLWYKTKSALHRLFPPKLSIDKILKIENNEAKVLAIHGGKFHGLEKGNSIFIFYEKEYMVRGKPTNRSVRVAQLRIFKLARTHCLGEVLSGGKALVKSVEEGIELKCIVKSQKHSVVGYGF